MILTHQYETVQTLSFTISEGAPVTREPENLITRMLLLGGGRDLRIEDLPASFGGPVRPVVDQLAELRMSEKELLSFYARNVLERQGGSKKKTLQILGIDYKTLQKRLKN